MTDSTESLATPNQTITVIWHIEDVQMVRPDLDAEQAYEVLTAVKRNHDATIGINWDVLSTIADILFETD